jgi:hypothetical protein
VAGQSRNALILWFVLFLCVTLAVLSGLDYFGNFELAYPILISITVLSVVIKIYPELYRKRWFWMTLLVFSLLHLFLIIYVPWKADWLPGSTLFIIALPDVALMIGVITFVQKLISTEKV